MADGHLNHCKVCKKAAAIKNREANVDYYREYDRQRANNPDRVEARKEYAKTEAYRESHNKANRKYNEANKEKNADRLREYRKLNPEKDKARYMISYAVKKGDLIKPKNCEDCGEETSLHGHHEDYSKPLDVIWVCPKCHGFRHRNDLCD